MMALAVLLGLLGSGCCLAAHRTRPPRRWVPHLVMAAAMVAMAALSFLHWPGAAGGGTRPRWDTPTPAPGPAGASPACPGTAEALAPP
ncbi:hypothetical protein [Streptomyces cucumeris]|uniref:hypothetical protein n=1 Tax=Streptomyces cucumeris TaxID=2962890 RepID=UPI003D762178